MMVFSSEVAENDTTLEDMSSKLFCQRARIEFVEKSGTWDSQVSLDEMKKLPNNSRLITAAQEAANMNVLIQGNI